MVISVSASVIQHFLREIYLCCLIVFIPLNCSMCEYTTINPYILQFMDIQTIFEHYSVKSFKYNWICIWWNMASVNLLGAELLGCSVGALYWLARAAIKTINCILNTEL